MAISAAIEMVYKVEDGIKLELTAWNDKVAPAGQPFLTIVDPTWIPEIGMYVDGGSEVVTIQRAGNNDSAEGLHVYYRPAWNTMYENFNNASLTQMAHWHQHGRKRGEHKP